MSNTKDNIIQWIDNLVLYEKDYDTLNILMNTNDRFFIRVMTELSKGNLMLTDFETVLGGISFDEYNKNKFELMKTMEEDLNLILEANMIMNSNDNELYNQVHKNLMVSGERFDLIEEVEQEELYDFFKNTPQSSLLYREHKNILLKLFNENKISSDFLNKYSGIPIIPINYKHIVLTEEDKKFALSKGISLDEVKKIKSLSYYYRVKGDNYAI